jgi:hypothetical protein
MTINRVEFVAINKINKLSKTSIQPGLTYFKQNKKKIVNLIHIVRLINRITAQIVR